MAEESDEWGTFRILKKEGILIAARSIKDVSIETGKTKTFSALDYAIFVGILVVSAGIGFYNAWKDRRQLTLKQFLLAGGNMQVFPVALSMLASFMSAITLLGTPVEMYMFSTIYVYIGLGYFFVMAGAAYIYVPVFYRLKITSVFEYLERRFSRTVRTAGSITYCVQMLLYMSIVLYAPSLALNQVTGFTLWGSVMSVGIVCSFYTAFGGMKAVLYTDVFQVAMMLMGLLAVLIRGSIAVGGFAAAWEKMDRSGRVIFDDFSLDPGVRHTFWSLVIGGYFTWVAVYGVNQAQVQRASTCPTLRRAQMALWLNVPGLWVILYLCSMIGVVVFAFYSDCDPIKSGFIGAKDQLLPLFVMDVLGDVMGLPGIFIAGLFSGALSTISSGLNALAAVLLEDVVKVYIYPDIPEAPATRLTQVFALVFGAICLALTYVASKLGNILQAALSLYGMISGPLLGVFTLGMIFPMANKWGGLCGLLTGLGMTFWIGIGAFITKPPVRPAPLPLSVAGCKFIINQTTTTPALTTEKPPVFLLYTLSYIWYGFYAVLIVIGVGLIVSYFTGFTDPKTVDCRMICPIFDIIPPFCFLPEKYRQRLRFGIRHVELEEERDPKLILLLESVSGKTIREMFEYEIIVHPKHGPSTITASSSPARASDPAAQDRRPSRRGRRMHNKVEDAGLEENEDVSAVMEEEVSVSTQD